MRVGKQQWKQEDVNNILRESQIGVESMKRQQYNGHKCTSSIEMRSPANR